MRDKLNGAIYGLAALALGSLALVLVTYLRYPGYLEHGEAAISAAAWLLLKGQPVYYPFGSPQLTSNVYGPFTFLWHALPLALFGGSVAASKAAGVTAAALIPITMAASHRRDGYVGMALAAALAAAMVLVHLGFPITIRPDSLLTALIAIAVWAAAASERNGGGWGATLVIAVVAGIAVDIKIHAAIYVAPVVLFHAAGNWRRLPVIAAVAAAVALLPFASSEFPLKAYLSWFGPLAGKENSWAGFMGVWWKLAIYLLTPAVLLVLGGRQRVTGHERIYLGAYVFSVLLVLLPATKNGGGHHYFLPFVPLLADLCLRLLRQGTTGQRRAIVGLLVIILALTWQTQRRFYKQLDWESSRLATAEIAAILKDHATERVQMGTGGGDNDYLNFYLYSWRNLPVFAGGPYSLDVGMVMEMVKLGVPMPAEALRRLRSCETEIWLIPAEERPFSLIGYYQQRVFTDAFRQAFSESYEKIETRAVFDLWRCRS